MKQRVNVPVNSTCSSSYDLNLILKSSGHNALLYPLKLLKIIYLCSINLSRFNDWIKIGPCLPIMLLDFSKHSFNIVIHDSLWAFQIIVMGWRSQEWGPCKILFNVCHKINIDVL